MNTFIHIFVLPTDALLAMDETGAAYLCAKEKVPEEYSTPEDHGQLACVPTFQRYEVLDAHKPSSPFAGLVERMRALVVGTEIDFNGKKATYVGVQFGCLEGHDFFKAPPSIEAKMG